MIRKWSSEVHFSRTFELFFVDDNGGFAERKGGFVDSALRTVKRLVADGVKVVEIRTLETTNKKSIT